MPVLNPRDKTSSTEDRSLTLLASAFLSLAEEMIEQENGSDTEPSNERAGLTIGSSSQPARNHRGGTP